MPGIVEEVFQIIGPAGELESIFARPAHARSFTCIICHPHPLYGGTMHNKVVTTLHRLCIKLGIKTVRFNFRGVQGSAGSYDAAKGEQEDVLAVKAWVEKTYPHDAIWLAGFSFGSYVSALVANKDPTIGLLISVAPPVNHEDFTRLFSIQCPWIFVIAKRDELVPYQSIIDFLATTTSTIEPIILNEATHFFHQQLGVLQSLLEPVLLKQLSLQSNSK